jgi:hypothetical protein
MSEEILKDPDALIFIIYRGIDGAMGAWEEYKTNGKNIAGPKYAKKEMEAALKGVFKKYLEKLPLSQKIAIKAFLSLSWSDVAKHFYDTILEIGKKDDGSYKNAEDTLFDILKKYFWREYGLPDETNRISK